MKKLISFVIPTFNEQKNIPLIHDALQAVMLPLSTLYDFEIIFVDDGSKDQSWDTICHLITLHSGISGIKLSRNFGHQIALMAGYDYAKGNAVISLDADLQHPPTLIPSMIAAWEQGSYIVCGKRTNWDDTYLKKITAALYYRLLERISSINIERGVGDFRLIDKQVVKVLRESKEPTLFLRGMVSWCGYQQTFLEYSCPARIHGTSGYSWKKMVRLAFDGIIGFSKSLVMFPLVIAVVAFGCGAASLAHLVVFNMTTLFFLFLTTQSLFVWIVLEYVSRIYEAARTRPLYVVEHHIPATILNSPLMHISHVKDAAH